MQLGSLTRFFRRESRTYDGNLFVASAEGRGQDVVFIHGLAASPHCWEQAVDRLGAGVRCHFIHIRGFAGEALVGSVGLHEIGVSGVFLKPVDTSIVIQTLKTRLGVGQGDTGRA